MTPKCRAILEKASLKMDGAVALYATEYFRPDNRLGGTGAASVAMYAFDSALKSASKLIGSGIPTDGWIVATDDGIGVFSRRLAGGGIGSHKGTVPPDLINSVSVKHAKKPGRAQIDIVFADMSEVTLFTKTKATYEALSPWVQGRNAVATSPLSGPGSSAPDAPDERLFDMDAIFETNPGLSNSH